MFIKGYLFAYNTFCAVAWAYTLFLVISNFELVKSADYKSFFDVVELPLFVAQSFAILEIFHSVFGLVRSPFLTNFLQVGSRLILIWGVNFLVPESRWQFGFALMVTVRSYLPAL